MEKLENLAQAAIDTLKAGACPGSDWVTKWISFGDNKEQLFHAARHVRYTCQARKTGVAFRRTTVLELWPWLL
jgi:hypothetical protein